MPTVQAFPLTTSFLLWILFWQSIGQGRKAAAAAAFQPSVGPGSEAQQGRELSDKAIEGGDLLETQPGDYMAADETVV